MSLFNNTLILFFFVLLQASQSACRQIKITNNCQSTIWPAFASVSQYSVFLGGSVGGYEAGKHTSFDISVSEDWEGWIWGRQVCDFSKSDLQSCLTGSCSEGGESCSSIDPSAIHVTTAVFSQNKGGWFDVDISRGFNLAMQIRNLNCDVDTFCDADFNPSCPTDQQLATNGGVTLACGMNSQLAPWYEKYCVKAVSPISGLISQICGDSGIEVTFCPDGTTEAPPPDQPKEIQSVGPKPSAGQNTPSAVTSATSSTPSASATLHSVLSATTSSGNTTTVFGTGPTATLSVSGSNTPSTSPAVENSQALSQRKMPTRTIAGIAIAGAVVCMGVIIAFLLCIRQKRRRRNGLPIRSIFRRAPRQEELISPAIFQSNDSRSSLLHQPSRVAAESQGQTSEKSLAPVRMSSQKGSTTDSVAYDSSQVSPLLQEANLPVDEHRAEVATISTSIRNYVDGLAPSSVPSDVTLVPSVVEPLPDLDSSLRRLFEDRRLESHLLRFLSQRMDPPGLEPTGAPAAEATVGVENDIEPGMHPPSYQFTTATRQRR